MISDRDLLARARDAGLAGLTPDASNLRASGLDPAGLEQRLEALAADGRLLALPVTPPVWISPGVWIELAQRLGSAKSAPLDLADRLPPEARHLVGAYAALYRGTTARKPRERLAQRVLEAYEAAGLTPPAPSVMARRSGHKPEVAAGLVEALIESGELTRLPDDLVVASRAIADLVERLRASPLDNFRVSEFTAWSGLSRKWAVPLLEHLDQHRVTRREGSLRKVRRQGADQSPTGPKP
ncbi:MAG: SelB C-terminal domain-containing protein [Acidobacteriota bacterium]